MRNIEIAQQKKWKDAKAFEVNAPQVCLSCVCDLIFAENNIS